MAFYKRFLAVRLTFILLSFAILLAPFTIAAAVEGSCSNAEPQPIGIDLGVEWVTSSYAHTADNITFLAAVQPDVADTYSIYIVRLRMEEHQRKIVSKSLEPRALPKGLFQSSIAIGKQYLSKVTDSFRNHRTLVTMADAPALQFLRHISTGIFPFTKPLLGAATQDWEDEMTPERIQSAFVNRLRLLKENAFEKNGINITFAILSVPDFFNQTIIDLLRAACVEVEIETVHPSSRTVMGAVGANTTSDARVLVVDQGIFHLVMRTHQEDLNDRKPLFQMGYSIDQLGSRLIDQLLVDRVIRTNEVLREQIHLGADRLQLESELYRARFLIKDDLDVWVGKSPEGQHHDEWPLDLKDWWIGEEQNTVLLWEDVEAVEETYLENLSASVFKFLVSLRMRRENSKDEHIAPEDIDVAVIMAINTDGDLLKRALRRALGDHVEIRGGLDRDAMFAADGAAHVAWTRLEYWEKLQRYLKQRYGDYKEGVDSTKVSICNLAA